MRRQNRYHVKGFLWGTGITAAVDIFLQWLEHHRQGRPFTWASYSGYRTISVAFVGGTAGAGLGELFYRLHREQERQQPFYPDRYLYKVLMREQLSADPLLQKKVEAFRRKVKDWITTEFAGSLTAPPEDSGSYYKKTQVAGNFDLDIIIPFLRGAHESLQHMSDDVFTAVKKRFGSEADVTLSKRAITLYFTSGDDDICIDLIPGREINCYTKDHQLNLYVRPDYFWQKGSSFKTNVRTQRYIPTHTPHIRHVILLLKIYRDRHCPSLPTLHIDMAASEAIRRGSYGVHRSLSENLLNSMDLLARLLEQQTVWDPCNSNNNFNDKLLSGERSRISELLLRDIQRIGEDKRYLKEIFEL